MSTESILRQEEGKKLRLYRCTAGKLTIGIGYNIEDRGLPDDIVEELFRRDLDALRRSCLGVPEYAGLDPVRQGVIERMVFQMGTDGVIAFKGFRGALKLTAWKLASDEMLDSKWARQTPARARREADRMLRGIE